MKRENDYVYNREAQVEEKRTKIKRLKQNVDIEAVEENVQMTILHNIRNENEHQQQKKSTISKRRVLQIDEDDDDMRDFIVDSDSVQSGDFSHKERDASHKHTKSTKSLTRAESVAVDSTSKSSHETLSITNWQSSFQPSSSATEEDKRRILGTCNPIQRHFRKEKEIFHTNKDIVSNLFCYFFC